MPQVKYTPDGLPYYDATDQQTQPYFPQVSGPMLPAPGNPAQPSEGWNQGVRDTLHGMTIGPVQDAAKALQGGMTGNEAQDFAFGAALGLLPMGRGLRPAQGIRAYHGSPHDFDRFDMSKIGTGEGAQAYGHGLYFAENEGVARNYRDALARGVDYKGTGLNIPEGPQGSAVVAISNKIVAGLDPIAARAATLDEYAKAAASARKTAAGQSGDVKFANLDRAKAYENILEAARGVNPKDFSHSPGRMYEVNINAHPDQFLDWDKPLSKQGADVQQSLGKVLPRGLDSMRGEQLYRTDLPHHLGVKKPDVSAALNEAGIPGIRYLDQGSRPINMGLVEQSQKTLAETDRLLQKYPGNPELLARRDALSAEIEANRPTRNYVVFDDKLIDIIKKYGIAAIAPLAAAMGLTADKLPIPKAQAPQL